jgi:hypothetical protein
MGMPQQLKALAIIVHAFHREKKPLGVQGNPAAIILFPARGRPLPDNGQTVSSESGAPVIC